MPIDYKKLYQSHDIILTNANPDNLVENGTLESVDYLRNYFKSRERYKPPVDFSKLKNFARFGSAKKYYVDAFDRIAETYPYDGSLKERIDWELSSSYFDLYVFDQVYPRSNGYVTISAEGWGTQAASSDHYGATATSSYEYIFIKGGPHGSQRSKDKDITDITGDYKSGYANIWEPAKNRESNLKIGGIDGNTVEFWMKKSEFVTSKTGREVIFDAATSDFTSSDAGYGRLTLEMTGTASGSPFLLTYMSGTEGVNQARIGSSVTTSSVADDNWHHYAFVMENSTTALTHRSLLFPNDDAQNVIAKDGTGSDLSFGDGTNDSPFTFSLWYKNTNDTANGLLLSKLNDSARGEYKVLLDGDGKISVYLYDYVSGVDAPFIKTDNAVAEISNGWVHIVCTYDGRGGATAADGLKIYINGASSAVTATNNADYDAMSNESNAPFVVGGEDPSAADPKNEVQGYITEVSVYNVELQPSEVSTLYNSGEWINQKHFLHSPVSWWRMGSNVLGSAPNYTIVDEMGANDLTMLNFDDVDDGVKTESPFSSTSIGLSVKLYVDGNCDSTANIGSSINEISDNINATIGSLIAAPKNTTQPTKGWGKLSGSLDEFRFWKDARTSPEVLRYMIEPVGGGTNTDDANTSLGVYYKFNEGITSVDSTDQTVLDYSGRISNGTFVGYNSSARNVGSAMVSSGLVDTEFKDPILYTTHPDVESILETKKKEGEIHDFGNNAAIYHSLPAWITEEDEDKQYSPLKNLTQIVGSYFDSLAEQINSIPQLKHKTYLSSSHKPAPFNDRLLNSIGFDYFPELFSDATELEYFRSRNDRSLFEKKLYDVKNRIYQNIYNNIIYINKTKGTEKSFRNLIHCFGLGDEIYRINTYGNRVTYTLKDNYKSIAEFKKYVNFGLTGSSEATVFPHSASSNSNSKAIISASYGTTDYLGFTMESEVHFPIRHSLADSNTVATTDEGPSRQFRTYIPFTTASLFGMHQVGDSATGNNLTWASTDQANFQVFAVKASDYSQRAQFVLTGTSDSVIGALNLTSSYIDDVFDDTRWTFSVSVKPNSNVNLPDGSSGSLASSGYTVEFYGVEKIVDYVKNEFHVSGTITADQGSKFLNYPKAPYIGAHRTNFSGTLLEKADGNISSTRVWYSHLPTGTIKQHHQDVKNFGVDHPYRSTYLYPTQLDGIKIPTIDTLVLNWTFDTVTGSDSSGEFIGEDYSSGSAEKVSKYGEFGELVGKQYLPKGFNFPASSALPINKKFISSGKKQLPEMINSSDMVNILTDDDRFFNKVDLLRPTNYYTSIEKSMYQTISDEMVKMFSSIKDFNNLVGEPVNKYRHEYKDMEKLRQLFYERVGNTPDLDKYVDFYKWVDITLDTLLGYLVPASSDMGDRYGSNIRTMVENTVLHRNKYKWQYPTFEDKTPDIEGNILGINELLYNWEFGFHPLNSEDNKCLWWKERAERGDALTSGDTNVDSNKQTMLDSIINETNATAPTLGSRDTSTGAISTYQGSTYVTRRLAKPLRLKVDESPVYKQSPSMYSNKNPGFFDAINKFKEGDEYGIVQVNSEDVENFKDCNDDLALNNGKRKYNFKAYSVLQSVPWASLVFNGSTSNVFITNSDLNFTLKTHSRSWSLWFKRDGVPSGNEWLLDHGAAVTHRPSLYLNTSGHVIYSDLAGTGNTASTTNYCDNEWHNVVMTIDSGGTQKIYIDGDLKDTDTFSATTAISGKLTIGAMASVSAFFEGQLDWFTYWAKTLSPSEVTELYNGGKLFDLTTYSAYANIKLWWRLGDTDASNSDASGVAYDFSGNGYAGTGVDVVKTTDTPDHNTVTAWQFFDSDLYKGAKIFPFNLYSASIEGGVNDTLNSSFMPGVDITNLHMDIYGPDYEVPMQTAFTEKFVGGRPHRHIFSNFRPNNSSPDGVDDRLEGWTLDISSSLSLRNADYGRINFPHSQFFRDEYAKRPVNIRNIKMSTGSSDDAVGRPDITLDTTNIGNYTDNYEVVMTNDRSINNRYLAEAPDGLPTTYSESTAVTGVVDFAMPRRDLTGSSKSIIVNRFSAPGDPATMGQGMLDFAAGEYSVYNSLTWRNLSVRMPLDEWYTNHANQFGFYSDTQMSSAYVLAGETYPGGNSTVSSADYSGTGSFHKVNRNPKKVKKYSSATSTSSFADDTVYDNWFVQHPIPRTDLQYSWITASVINGYTGAALYDYEQPDFSNASLASTDILFQSASQLRLYKTNSAATYQLWARDINNFDGNDVSYSPSNETNIVFYEPITSSTNTAGFPKNTAHYEYLNIETVGTTSDRSIGNGDYGAASILNGLLWHRGSQFGWPSWKQIRGAQHPVMRYNYKNNLQTFKKLGTIVENNGAIAASWTTISQSEPPITSKFWPLKYNFDYKTSVGNVGTTNMWTSYGNEKSYFTSPPDPNITGLTNLNNSNLVWSKAGQVGETLQDADNQILAYDTMKKYLLWNTPEYINGSANPIETFHKLEIVETVFPREHYTYRAIVRQRENFSNNFWRDSRSERNTTTINSQGFEATASGKDPASMWSLDSRADLSSTSAVPVGSGSEGELQNSYSIFYSGSDKSTVRAAATYSRRIQEKIDGVTYFLGDTQWEAGEQSGYNPSYDTYSEFVQDVRTLGKDYGIVPEYRLSEHMEYHVVDKASDGGFFAKNPSWLSLSGATISSSNDPDHDNIYGEGSFYTVYANSDFMKYFEPINTDFNAVGMPTRLKLKCSAITKFLPYDGFYPSERTVQLAEIFSQSFGPNATLMGTDANWKTLLTPFFAPGIMYNSIKSGIAVDYPVFDEPPSIVSRVILSDFDKRIPFEAIVDPDYWLSGLGTIHDTEPDSNHGAIVSSGSFGASSNNLFKYAINNFMAEAPRFFLGGTDGYNGNPYGPLTTFASKPTQEGTVEGVEMDPLGGKAEGNFIYFEANKSYKMRIVCRHSKINTLEAINKNPDYLDGTASYIWNEPTIMMYNRAFNRSDTSEYADLYYDLNNGDPESAIGMHHAPIYGSSFGPPVSQVTSSTDGSQTAGGFEPYTPPYYNGYSHIEITYTPEYAGYKTISDVLSDVSASYHRVTLQSGSNASRARDQAMHLSSSVNWRQVVTEGGKTRWVIQPKWESPILDFKESSITLPTVGSGSVAKGMWHQYGSLPRAGAGVFLEIQSPSGDEIGDSVGDLADKLGFSTNTSKQLGQIPSSGKTVKEAVVAIPFYKNFWGQRTFFHLNRKTINWAIAKMGGGYTTDEDYMSANSLNDYDWVYKPSGTVVDMVKSMYKYSLPPSINFLLQKDKAPFSMVFFEFDHHFTQDDLVKMWQGILPSEDRKDAASGVQHAVSEIEFDMNLLSGREALYSENPDPSTYKGWDLLNAVPGNKTGDLGFPTDIQWMVFKVKQKAASHYYSLTADRMDDYGSPTLNYLLDPTPLSFLPQFKFWETGAMSLLSTVEKAENIYRYNWPYDFFSLVELAKIDKTIVMEQRKEIPDTFPNIGSLVDLLPDLNMNFIPFFDSVTSVDPNILRGPYPTEDFMDGSGLPGWTKFPEWVPDISPVDLGRNPERTQAERNRQNRENTFDQNILQSFSATQFVSLQAQNIANSALQPNYLQGTIDKSIDINTAKGTQKKDKPNY